jgi:hypothetical protein
MLRVTGAYIEIIGGKMDLPLALGYAHRRLKATVRRDSINTIRRELREHRPGVVRYHILE